MRRRLVGLVATAGLAALGGLVRAQTPELPAGKIAAFEAAVSATMARQGIPGITAAVAIDRQLRWTNGYGLADVENSVPAKAGTVYRLGSVSKPITAVAALQLVERGLLDLDAPIQKYAPSFPEKPWPVTTRLLLGHLAGVRTYAEGEFDSTRHYASLREGLDIFKNDPLVQEPGTKYLYSSYGYNLVGTAVEEASGAKFADYLRENIFGPAGMEQTRVDDVFEIVPNRAQGYRRRSSGELANSGLADTSYKIPSGGLCSTAADVARFAIAVETGALLRKESMERMFTTQRTRDGKPTGYGLGWRVETTNGRLEALHTGGQQRVSTVLYLQPDRGLAVALLCNLEGQGPALIELARQLAEVGLR